MKCRKQAVAESLTSYSRRQSWPNGRNQRVILSSASFSFRKRPHVEEAKEDLTAASLPRRRVIKLTSIKELREDIEQQTHKGQTISA